jgi:hypothetical protein
MNGNTVRMGHVSTRVCLRGSCSTTSIQGSNRCESVPGPCSTSKRPSAKSRAPALDLIASRSAIFSKENNSIVRPSMRAARCASSTSFSS